MDKVVTQRAPGSGDVLIVEAAGISVRFRSPYYEIIEIDVRPAGSPHPGILVSAALPFTDTHSAVTTDRAVLASGYLRVEFSAEDERRAQLYSHDFPAGTLVFGADSLSILLDDAAAEPGLPGLTLSPSGVGLIALSGSSPSDDGRSAIQVPVGTQVTLVHGPALEKQRNRAALALSLVALSEQAG
jgi:hypothetical protein